MERERNFYRTPSKDFTNKILFALGFIGLPLVFGFAAYFWMSRKNKTSKGKSTSGASQRVKKGIPPGLINLGNTCFINCLLQALSSVTNFCKWIEAIEDDKDKILLSSLKDITKVLNNKKEMDQDIFSASDIIESLNAHGWIGTSQQQDAHEFFQVLTSTLEDELTATEKDHPGFIFGDESSRQLEGIINRACRNIEAIPPPLESPFKGSLANRMTCLSCGYQSVRFDPFESISLRIPPMIALNGLSLDSCLAEFTRSEQIDDVICPGCTKAQNSRINLRRRFSKQLTFAKLPKCICLHIQRSCFLSDGTSYKSSKFVRFTDTIDLSPYRYHSSATKFSNGPSLMEKYMVRERSPALRGGSSKFSQQKTISFLAYPSSLYRLKSVIVHIGEVWNGHFVTYRRAIKTADDWVFSSDDYTRLVSKQSVLSSSAYVLFYERSSEVTN